MREAHLHSGEDPRNATGTPKDRENEAAAAPRAGLGCIVQMAAERALSLSKLIIMLGAFGWRRRHQTWSPGCPGHVCVCA